MLHGISKSRIWTSFADADDAAGQPGTRISGGETELVSSLAEIVNIGVNDDGTTDDGKRSGEGNLGIGDLDASDAVGAGLDVAQVTGVANFVDGGAVGLAVRVEVSAGGGASVGIVAEFVDVEAVVSLGQAAQLSFHGNRSTDVGLGEVNGALHHIAVQHAHSLQRHF